MGHWEPSRALQLGLTHGSVRMRMLAAPPLCGLPVYMSVILFPGLGKAQYSAVPGICPSQRRGTNQATKLWDHVCPLLSPDPMSHPTVAPVCSMRPGLPPVQPPHPQYVFPPDLLTKHVLPWAPLPAPLTQGSDQLRTLTLGHRASRAYSETKLSRVRALALPLAHPRIQWPVWLWVCPPQPEEDAGPGGREVPGGSCRWAVSRHHPGGAPLSCVASPDPRGLQRLSFDAQIQPCHHCSVPAETAPFGSKQPP